MVCIQQSYTNFELNSKSQLQIYLNCPANEGILPQEWKEAIVTPLFKKGSKANQRIIDQ